jgi:hypothetical protein
VQLQLLLQVKVAVLGVALRRVASGHAAQGRSNRRRCASLRSRSAAVAFVLQLGNVSVVV